MGRGGSSGGHSSGSSHRSGGSHGSSHSHSRSSSSFGRASRSSSGGGFSFSSGSSGSYRHSRSYGGYGNYGGGYGGGYGYGGGMGSIGRIIRNIIIFSIIVPVVLQIIFALIGGMSSSSGIAKSTTQRHRVDTKNAYVNDCIVDELGWIKNKDRLSKNLKYFYEKTGCQPYIYLRAYDGSMSSDRDREAWTQDFYDTEFKDLQNTLLYVYFCDQGDEGEGDSTLWMGTESSVVMDSEAVDIFWSYLDYDWDNWDVNDNDGMFADVFTKTADRIMTVTTNGFDVMKYAIVGVVIIGSLVVVFLIIRAKFRRQREHAQETIDILNAPLDTRSSSDDLADRYNNQ